MIASIPVTALLISVSKATAAATLFDASLQIATMASQFPPSPHLLLLLLISFSSTSLSYFLSSSSNSTSISIPTSSPTSSSSPPSRGLLDEIIASISRKERWDPDAEVRVSSIDAAAAGRVAAARRYEFRARVGPASGVVARLVDDALHWRRAAAPVVEVVGSELVAGAGASAASGFGDGPRNLELVGPVELRVDGDRGGDWIALQLPSINTTYTRLKKILIADGIRIEVVGAREVSLAHPHDIGLLANGSLVTYDKDKNPTWALGYSSCAPLLTVHTVGSIFVVARNSRRPGAPVKCLFKSRDTIELLSDECYVDGPGRLISACFFCSVSPRLMLIEKVLMSWIGKRPLGTRSIRFVKAKVTSLTLVKFRLELEKDITEQDRIWKKTSEWKTKPSTQRVLLEVVARVEEEGRLKAVLVKKVRRPFPLVDTTAWSSLTSNVSFTQFSLFLIPPEALTLDVKW